MIGAVLAILLLSGSPQAAPESATPAAAPAASHQTAAIAPGMMSCVFEGRRNRTCTTSEGEVLRCQRQRQLGSRFDTWVCLTYQQDQTIQRDSRTSLEQQQHITIPDPRNGD